VGDTQATYYEPASADRPASLTYRFTVGQYGVRLTVLARSGEETSSASLVEELGQTLDALAVKQYNKFVELAYGDIIDSPTNVAIEHLPASLPDTTVLGTATVNFMEWYGLIYNLDSDEFPEFQSGGLRSFHLATRPDEVVEVIVFAMESAEQANDYVSGLLPSLPGATELTLPDSLATAADAVTGADLIELQVAQGVYVIDVSILAPFGVMDQAAAEVDLITFSEQIVDNFAE
jgi:hypothetical protein